jgi:methyltransferase (TIGR00027 family)
METDDSLSRVGETAIGAAMMRADESTRADRLFDDPYAAAFVAAVPDAFTEGPEPGDPEITAIVEAFRAHMAVRTRFYDDYLRTACDQRCQQVVLLAAGLDTRAFRLHWRDGVRFFEIDLPEVLSFKDVVLTEQHATPRCTRITVSIDLRDEWPMALIDAGFDVDLPSAWTAEGLLAYLSDDEAVRLLTCVSHLSSPDSHLALETARVADDATLSHARDLPALDQITTMWKGGLQQDATDWLEQHGWRVEKHDRQALSAAYGRPAADGSTGEFLTATRT